MINNMGDILEKMKSLSEYDKEVWESIAKNLFRNQNDMINGLKDSVRKQMAARTAPSTWHIVTAAIPKEELEQAQKNGMFEILDTVCFSEKMQFEDLKKIDIGNNVFLYSAGISFLKCDYHSKLDFLNPQKYVAKVMINDKAEYEVEYYFERYDAYINEERVVERAAMQYEVDVPVIFEPISRRAVRIVVDLKDHEFSKSDNAYIDFQLDQNGLLQKLLINYTLIWNVEITEKSEIPRPHENSEKSVISKVVPRDSKVYKVYEFPAEDNEFYYIDSAIHDVKRFGSSIYMNLHEEETIESVRYYKVILHKVNERYLEKIQFKFAAFFNKMYIHKSRIRTEADIDYVMKMFQNDVAKYLGFRMARENDEAVYTYDTFDAYYYPKNKFLRSKSICNIRFEKSDNIFFEDYISYILSFMNYYYPEFYWVGVI